MAQGILLLVSQNFTEEEVLDMPLDKYHTYLRAYVRNVNIQRAATTSDTLVAVSCLFSKKPREELLKYVRSMNPPE